MGNLDDAANMVQRAAHGLTNGDAFAATQAVITSIQEAERYVGVILDQVRYALTIALGSGATPGGRMASEWAYGVRAIENAADNTLGHMQAVISEASHIAAMIGDVAARMDADSHTIRSTGTA